MGDDRSNADKLDREGADPSIESGAGYGDHAPSPQEQDGDKDE